MQSAPCRTSRAHHRLSGKARWALAPAACLLCNQHLINAFKLNHTTHVPRLMIL
jgi:hypothetical protein